ncbi:MAG: hypothetical protein JWO80_244 [Bryobacterales bacterium]|nr:hypothetical protein [Bryobacterales bacterium]
MQRRTGSVSHAVAVAKLGEAAEHASEFREHLAEIIGGPTFKGSPRSQEFLRYIVEHSLRGEFDNLRERTIGVALFGRPADYDTTEDAIVRVTASDVRKRLLQHYGAAGADSRCRIHLPSGSYVPEFQCTPPAPPDTFVEVPEATAVVPAKTKTSLAPWWRRGRLAIVALIVVAIGVTGWDLHDRILIRTLPPQNFISRVFGETPGPVQLVVADDALVLIQVLLGRRFTLLEYENLGHLALPELVAQKDLQHFWRILATRQITNLGDLQNVTRIADGLRWRGRKVNVRQARQVNAREFRTGDFVILGSSFSNPWADLFQVEDSNFAIPPVRPGLPAPILNRHPLAGEPSRFEVHPDPKTGKVVTYARVTLLPNTGRSGRVLLVAGLSMAATEMAGDFLLTADSVGRTLRNLGLPVDSPIPDLEMLLRVTEVNEIGDSVELVSCRRVRT